jgi:WD40 repeat protein
LHFWNRKTGKHESIASWTDKHGPNIALSSEGKILASVNNAYLDEPNICIWDMVAQKTIRQFGTNLVQGVFVALSPDGQILADMSHRTRTKPYKIIRLWDTATGSFLREIQDLEFMNPSLGRSPILAFSPNGHLFAAARPDKSVGLWEVHSGKLIRQLNGQEELPFVVTFAPNGRVLASGGQEGSGT